MHQDMPIAARVLIMGAYYKLEWLYNLFIENRVASKWACATRAYMLMLEGCTIFVDKIFTLVKA